MALKVTGSMPAGALMQDDWFCLGGKMMRVKDIERDSMWVTLHFYCPEDTTLGGELKVMEIHPIELFNQYED